MLDKSSAVICLRAGNECPNVIRRHFYWAVFALAAYGLALVWA